MTAMFVAVATLGGLFLDGGSDVDEVYSFTWVNCVFAGVLVQF